MTKKNLQQIKVIVHEILKDDEMSRNDDDLLYLSVIERFTKDTECPVTPYSMTLAYFLINRKKHRLPKFESVRRARQKLQKDHPELKACEKVEAMRQENEKAFREFALLPDQNGVFEPAPGWSAVRVPCLACDGDSPDVYLVKRTADALERSGASG